LHAGGVFGRRSIDVLRIPWHSDPSKDARLLQQRTHVFWVEFRLAVASGTGGRTRAFDRDGCRPARSHERRVDRRSDAPALRYSRASRCERSRTMLASSATLGAPSGADPTRHRSAGMAGLLARLRQVSRGTRPRVAGCAANVHGTHKSAVMTIRQDTFSGP
jgi:hypothetical protein